MIRGRAVLMLLALLGADALRADEIYRCQSYGGGLFWSQQPCSQRGALIDRIESVPDGMSFERQVRVAEQAAAAQAAAPVARGHGAARPGHRQPLRCGRSDAEPDCPQDFGAAARRPVRQPPSP